MASHEQVQAWDDEHVIHPWSFAGPSLLLVRGGSAHASEATKRAQANGRANRAAVRELDQRLC